MSDWVLVALNAELDTGIAMENKIVKIPEWMIKTLKNDSKLGAREILDVFGYTHGNIGNIGRMMEQGLLPKCDDNRNSAFTRSKSVRTWAFGRVKEFVKEHNEKLKI